MTWDDHIYSLSNTLSKISGTIARCHWFLPVHLKIKISYALFNSHINYCHLIRGATTKTNFNKSLLLQQKRLHHVASVFYNHHTEPLFVITKLQASIASMGIVSYMQFLFLPLKLDFIHRVSEIAKCETRVRTRSPEEWLVPRSKTDYNCQTPSLQWACTVK